MVAKKPVYVTIQLTSSLAIKYGFGTTLDESYFDDLGIKPRTAADACIFGTSTPKPPRASIFKSGNYHSSFVSQEAIATAAAAGWRISYPNGQASIGATTRSVTVYIEIAAGTNIPEINYAWNMPKKLYDAIGAADRASLGIKDAAGATSVDKDRMIFQSNAPKPTTAKKRIETPEGISYLKTFAELGSQAAGWSVGTRVKFKV